MRKLICKLFGHRSICIFTYTYKWDHENWAQTSSVHVCERCEEETRKEWQQGV